MRLLIGADFHLGARQNYLGERAEARRDDLSRALTRFADFALRPENRLDAVLLLGDLFDHHAPPAPLVGHAAGEIDRLLAGGIAVVAIPGTHDGYGYRDSVYRSGRLPAGMTLIVSPELTRTTITPKGTPLHLYAMAYDPSRTPNDPLCGLRRDSEAGGGFHVGMVHGSLPAGPEWDYRGRDVPIPTADLASSELDMLALGHYHNFLEKRFGRTVAVYPGTLEGLKYSESGERAYVIADLSDGGVRLERTPYPGRRIVDEAIDLDLLGGTAGILEERIRSLGGADRIVRVRLSGHAPPRLDVEAMKRRLAPEFFFLFIDDRTVDLDPRWAERLAAERTVRGLFVRRMNERIAAASGDDRPRIEAALRHGLAEFGLVEAADVD